MGPARIYSAAKNNNDIAQHIRTCQNEINGERHAHEDGRDTGFMISFLGTGGGTPSAHRMTSATLLRLGGISFLFDAGEGVQQQLSKSKVNTGQISKIFITHMHADHIYGLPGLLLGLKTFAAESNKLPEQRVLEIYGPVGLYNYIVANLAFSQSTFRDLTVFVYEMVGGIEEGRSNPRGSQWKHQPGQRNDRHILKDHYPELMNNWIIRKRLKRGVDRTWTLQTPTMTESERAFLDKYSQNPTGSCGMNTDVNSGSKRQLHITAAEVMHKRGVQTFGFVVQEPDPPKIIDPKKAINLGLKPGPKYRLLKNGVSVMSDDGTKEIQPENVVSGTSSKARKFALVGDNYDLSKEMKQLCEGCDVLVHEATLSEANSFEARKRGHSTPEMAGSVAKSVNAEVLVLNHISPSVVSEDDNTDVANRAEQTNKNASRVVVSHDFMELLVPRLGFDFSEEARKEDEGL